MLEYLLLKRSGFFSGVTITRIDNRSDRLELDYYKNSRKEKSCIHFHDKWSNEQSKRWLTKLEKLHLEEWEDDYWTDILDGEQWELHYKFVGQNERRITGSNAYPENWGAFTSLITSAVQKLPEDESFNEEDMIKALISFSQ